MTSETNTKSSHPILNVLTMFIKAMVGAYALNTLIHIILWLLIGERWVVVEFFNTFAQLLWLPTLILLPLSVVTRQWRIAGMMLPAFISFFIIWGDMLLPVSEITTPEDTIVLEVLNHNIYAGNRNTDELVTLYRESNADVIVLQELDFYHAPIFESQLANDYPYMAFHPGGTAGHGIMSRYPITSDEYFEFDYLRRSLGHQRVELALTNSQTIVLYSAHPTHPGMQDAIFTTEFRSREIDDLLVMVEAEALPVILAGDFNMPDFSSDYRQVIDANLQDSFRQRAWGFGWTFSLLLDSSFPFLRLDYIFATEDFITLDADVANSAFGSDHYPVTAEFALISPTD